MITREKRATNLGCDGGIKPAQVDVSIKLLSITLQCHWVCGWVTKIDLLNEVLQVGKVSMKQEITLIAGEKGLKDLDHMTNVRLIGIHSFKSLSEGACQLNTRKRLSDILLDGVRHKSDDS